MADVVFLSLVVANPDLVLTDYDRVKVYRSTAGRDGPYTEVTTPTSRIVLLPGVLVYPFQDPVGSSGYWYATAYYNSATQAESGRSDPLMGQGDAALSVVGVDDLKARYLFGFDLTDKAGNPFPTSMFEFFIKAAVSSLEKRLDIAIRPCAVVDERHHYYPHEFENYCYVQLKKYPASAVQQVRLVWPGGQATPIVFTPDMVSFDGDRGTVQILPGVGPYSAAPAIATGFGFGGGMWGRQRYVPDVVRVDYTAGFTAGQVPDDIADLVGKMAAFGPLNLASDLLGGGGVSSTSIGIDGLSQSVSLNGGWYGTRLAQYAQDIERDVAMLRRHYKGIPTVVA